jgi:N-acylneuraminate cytidylyltransferase
MIDNQIVVSIITARGGSKGLPGKNTRPLLNHPLIAYSIKASLDCPLIDRTLVSTDSEEIAAIARQYGAEVPFIRPEELAGDLSRDIEVFEHALQWMEVHEQYRPDMLVHLRPTSPIRFLADIETCIRRLAAHPEAEALRIVTPSPITPFKMWWVTDAEVTMKPLLVAEGIAEPYNEPRQNLPQTYWQTGTLDITRRQTILEKKSMTGRNILPFVVDNKFVADIDDLASFERAAAIIQEYDCIKFDD